MYRRCLVILLALLLALPILPVGIEKAKAADSNLDSYFICNEMVCDVYMKADASIEIHYKFQWHYLQQYDIYSTIGFEVGMPKFGYTSVSKGGRATVITDPSTAGIACGIFVDTNIGVGETGDVYINVTVPGMIYDRGNNAGLKFTPCWFTTNAITRMELNIMAPPAINVLTDLWVNTTYHAATSGPFANSQSPSLVQVQWTDSLPINQYYMVEVEIPKAIITSGIAATAPVNPNVKTTSSPGCLSYIFCCVCGIILLPIIIISAIFGKRGGRRGYSSPYYGSTGGAPSSGGFTGGGGGGHSSCACACAGGGAR